MEHSSPNPLSRSFAIGNVQIEQPLALAPMAEVTDTYYRSLVKELGGVGLVVSEFISAEGLTRKNDRSHQMLAFEESERPVAIQIYGGDPERMDDAAAIVEEQGVDIVDSRMADNAGAHRATARAQTERVDQLARVVVPAPYRDAARRSPHSLEEGLQHLATDAFAGVDLRIRNS